MLTSSGRRFDLGCGNLLHFHLFYPLKELALKNGIPTSFSAAIGNSSSYRQYIYVSSSPYSYLLNTIDKFNSYSNIYLMFYIHLSVVINMPMCDKSLLANSINWNCKSDAQPKVTNSVQTWSSAPQIKV